MKNDLNHYKCTLTNLIYSDPVIAEDGYIYEKIALKHYLKYNKISPITQKSMGTLFIKANQFKLIINDLLNKNPKLINQQFLNKKPYYLFKNEFKELLIKNKFNELICYTNITLNDIILDQQSIACYIFKNCDNDNIIKIIIDNSIDFDCDDNYGNRPIHYACQYTSDIIIKYMIDKGVDINIPDKKGNKPIHYITKFQYNSGDIIKYLIRKETQIECVDENGLFPIHILCKKLTNWDNLIPFLDNKYNLELLSNEGMKPIHYICKHCADSRLIKKFMNMNIILDSYIKNSDVSCDNLIYENELLDKQTKQELVYFYLERCVF